MLEPVLDRYGVGFRVMHGFSSATVVHDIAADRDRRRLTALDVGDWDPSGLYMSECDLPDRLLEYRGLHVRVKRVALMRDQLSSLPSFDSGEKRSDPRYKWFMFNYGRVDRRCWEIDALDPNVLREIIEGGIAGCIKDTDAWERCELVNEAERESLQGVLTGWAAE